MELPTDPFSVSLALSHGGIRGISDGSVWMKKLGALFGWTVSNDLGDRALECTMGPAAPGANPNSYRSEAYGMLLSMLCFFRRLAEYTHQHEPWTGILATDSLRLIDTIRGVRRDAFGRENDEDRILASQP